MNNHYAEHELIVNIYDTYNIYGGILVNNSINGTCLIYFVIYGGGWQQGRLEIVSFFPKGGTQGRRQADHATH